MGARTTQPSTGHSASDLVTVGDGQPVTTTERVAAAAGLHHASVIKLVREHMEDFSALGEVRFQLRLNAQGSPTEYAVLGEQQAALLVLFQRNTAKVRAFKLRMVKDFARVTAELQRLTAMQSAPPPVPALPADYSAALRALADLNDASQRTALALAGAEARIAEQAPAVAAQARLAVAPGELCMADAAKSLGVAPRALADRMAGLGWTYRRDGGDGRTGPWRARQTQIDAGRLRHRVVVYPGRDGGERRTDQVMVTPCGLAKLAELLAGGGE